MSFFQFNSPSRAEILSVLQQAKNDPESLDGREMWIYKMLKGGDF